VSRTARAERERRKIALLDTSGEELGVIFAGHLYARTQVPQRFQFAIAQMISRLEREKTDVNIHLKTGLSDMS
jgi:hypothetical protein